MGSQLRTGRRNEVRDRAIAGDGILRANRGQRAWAIGSANSIELAAHTDSQLQTLVQQEYLILAKDCQGPLPIGRPVEGTERRDRVLEECFVLKLKSRGCQMFSPEPCIQTTIQCVSSSLVHRHKFEIAERVKSGELRIDPGAIVISSFIGYALVGDGIRDRLVHLLCEPDRSGQQSVAATLVRVIKVRVKIDPGDRFGESLAGSESSRQRKRRVVNARVRDGRVKVSRDSCRWCRVK